MHIRGGLADAVYQDVVKLETPRHQHDRRLLEARGGPSGLPRNRRNVQHRFPFLIALIDERTNESFTNHLITHPCVRFSHGSKVNTKVSTGSEINREREMRARHRQQQKENVTRAASAGTVCGWSGLAITWMLFITQVLAIYGGYQKKSSRAANASSSQR